MKKKRFKIKPANKSIIDGVPEEKSNFPEKNSFETVREPEKTNPEIIHVNEIPVTVDTPMKRSHLKKRMERQSKRTFIITTFGIIILISLLIIFGQTLLINFSVLLGATKNNKQINNQEEVKFIYIAPPVLDPVTDATNSASLRITGVLTTDLKAQVKIYLNGELADVTETDQDDMFTFEEIKLKEGENSIKAVAVAKNNKSADSNILTVIYSKDKPEITIENPQDGSSYSGDNNTIVIKGKTNPGLRVTVNSYIATTRSDGSYSYPIKLQNGENKIKVTATDKAGNTATKEITVNYH